MTGMEIVRPGPLSLIEDLGRPGLASSGVGRSGAADRGSFLLANRMLGNPDDAAAIECTLGGLVVRARGEIEVLVTGAPAPAKVDGTPVEHGVRIPLQSGQELRLGVPRTGLRSYLAARGGIDVPSVLGSRSTDTLSGLGPAPLRAGDLLPIGRQPESEPADELTLPAAEPQNPLALSVDLGPRDDWFVRPDDLLVGEWLVSPNSNRVGLRLDRPDPVDDQPALRRQDDTELPSEGVALGSIQVPPSGQPVLFLADHPVTGGYPVLAVVRGTDVDLAAQARPGQRLRFVLG
ncbi:MAG: biotin-dependent carboxyltransferase family protein [Nakamurella sp.]